MNYITNFYKLLIIILLIIILLKLINNMRENFQESNKILFNIKKFNNTSIEMTWNNDNYNKVQKYIIVKYVNNNGPYLTVVNNKSNRHIIDNIQNSILYKIGIVSIDNNNNVSNIKDNIKQFTLSVFNDTPEVKYINSFKNNIYCDPKGAHKIVGQCPDNKKDKNNIIATYKLNKENESINYFNDEIHDNLMDDLTKPSEDTIKFELKI
jgi:hypothetical protein